MRNYSWLNAIIIGVIFCLIIYGVYVVANTPTNQLWLEKPVSNCGMIWFSVLIIWCSGK
jgi:hypothetical protein